MDQRTRDRLQEEHHQLQGEFGWSPFRDGQVRDRIARIEAMLAADAKNDESRPDR